MRQTGGQRSPHNSILEESGQSSDKLDNLMRFLSQESGPYIHESGDNEVHKEDDVGEHNMEKIEFKPQWKKWLILYIAGVIIFSFIAKVLDFLSSDVFKIVLNSIFTGIGTAIGMYIGGGLIVEKMFKPKKEEEKDKEQKI